MAFTFLKGMGIEIGQSICEEDRVKEASDILEEFRAAKKKLVLPVDLVAADKLDSQAKILKVSVESGIPKGFQGVDIGEKTIQLFSDELKKGKTMLNGPVGVFEIEKFSHGTRRMAEVIAWLDATTIVGGGDSVAAVNNAHLANKMTHISTGGGAYFRVCGVRQFTGH